MTERLIAGERPDPSRKETAAPPPPRIPAQPTPLIGRESDLAALQALLWRSEVRLITLTGTGGVGKTRLAVAAAESMAHLFTDGVWFVDLSDVQDAELVPVVVARTLGINAEPRQSLPAAIEMALCHRDMLLILDNCEQIPAAALQFARWLRSCPGLVLLATSRVALDLRWEYEYPVAPLRLPDQGQRQTPARLAAVPAVALFVARARSTDPGVALDDENAAPVAALCQRLDGLPLAIELAAHLVRLLPPRAVLDRLEAGQPLPLSVLRDLPERQQSLQAAVGWSYALLAPAARRLFRRLAVIPGGFTIDLARRVAGAADDDLLLADLHELVGHNLLRPEPCPGGARRFAMLKTIRSYAAAELGASGEAEESRAALVGWARDLVLCAGRHLIGPEQATWLARLDLEAATIEQALRRAIDERDTATALRMVAALWWAWYVRGLCVEGRAALAAALALPGEETAPARAHALLGLGTLAYLQGDIEAATAAATAGLALGRALESPTAIALGLNLLGNVALWKGDPDLARGYYETQIASQRRAAAAGPLPVPARFGLALSLNNLGVLYQEAGEDRRAAELHEEGLALMRGIGDRQGMAHTLLRLGEARERLGEQGVAAALIGEALDYFRGLGDRWGTARSLLALGRVRLRRDEPGPALDALREGLALFQRAGIQLGIVESCEAFAEAAARGGQVGRGTRLLAAATAMRGAIDAPRTPRKQAAHDDLVRRLQRLARPGEFAVAWSAGLLLSQERAVALALATGAADPAPGSVAPGEGAAVPRLTRRERQVALLLARGLTNRQIAERLFNSERTIESHVQKIGSKLGFTRRTQIVAWVYANGLCDDDAALS